MLSLATKKDLQYEISRLNNKYCKGGKNKLTLDQAYGGYQVQLTGKRKKTGGWYKNSLGSGCASITTGYESATKTLDALYKADSKGWLRSSVKHHNRRR